MASIDRTAYPRFTRAVSARELAEVFTPSADEVEWARGKTHDDQPLLALLVWLKAYQRLGHFPKLAEVPAVVAEHIRSVVGHAAPELRAHSDLVPPRDEGGHFHRSLRCESRSKE
ncbi:DUF4158 domain-containing protein [Streptosporangium sp. NPDC002544]|uniref:DUF4158 domain-containing protein n=1 Tax=Streptosporangium sp. NPDC002544 TaxID=3154538 RepID=UPI00331CE74E